MTLGAVSLRSNNECCKPQAQKAQNFGKKEQDGAPKSHKAAYITGGLVAFAALATAAYVFRGKLAKLPFVDTIMKKGSEYAKNIKDFGRDTASKAAEKAGEVKESLSESLTVLAQKANELKDKAIELLKKVKPE